MSVIKINNRLSLRPVCLNGGKYDGMYSVASHGIVDKGDDVYVQSDKDPDNFISTSNFVTNANPDKYKEEVARVRAYYIESEKRINNGQLPPPLGVLIGISPMRIQIWKYALEKGFIQYENDKEPS